MPRRKKTEAEKARDRRKRARKRAVKAFKKKVNRTTKKAKKRVKKTRKKLARSAKRSKKTLIRKGKRVRKAAQKQVRAYKRKRAKAIRAQYRRKNIKDDGELENFTSDRTKATGNTAYLPQYENDSGASKPGEPPKKRTGRGQAAISAQLITHKTKQHDVKARTYVDKRKAAYMAMWEYRQDGEGRPFMEPTLKANKALFRDLLGNGIRKRLKGKSRKR